MIAGAIGELTSGVVELAAQLRAFHGLKTPDALQAATALSLPGDTIFVTGDPRFKDMPGLTVELV